MMKQPDREHFEEAMRKEIQDLFDNEIWEKVSRQSMYD